MADLAFQETGDPKGPPLLLLHGIGGLGEMWAPAAEHLPQFRCILPDLPGHGASRKIPWRSFAKSAEAVEALIRKILPARPVHIAGLSRGAYVALHITARSAVQLGRVMASGVPFSPLPQKTMMRVMSYAMLPFIRMERMARANMKALRLIDERAVSAAIAGAKAVSRRAFLRANLDAVAYTPPHDLQKSTTPLLILAGAREHVLIRDDLARVQDWAPSAEAALVPGLGHGWPGEDAALFATVASAWLRDGRLHAALEGSN